MILNCPVLCICAAADPGNSSVCVLSGHRGNVNCVRFSKSGLLASGGDLGEVFLWAFSARLRTVSKAMTGDEETESWTRYRSFKLGEMGTVDVILASLSLFLCDYGLG